MRLIKCVFLSCLFIVDVYGACVSGKYSLNEECVTCPAGSYCPGNGTRLVCPDKTYSRAGAQECVLCSDAYPYVDANHTKCVKCDGDLEYVVDNFVCMKCSRGSYMTNGECKTCPAGTYCPGDGTKNDCPRGSFSAGGVASCVACPVGYTTDSTSAQSVSDCKQVKVKISFGNFGDDEFVFPECLSTGKINSNVVKNKTTDAQDD